ncbi:MAG: hypothetical protein ACOZB3_00875 [Calditrichota bacterium]
MTTARIFVLMFLIAMPLTAFSQDSLTAVVPADTLPADTVAVRNPLDYYSVLSHMTPDSALWARLAPDTTRTDLVGMTTNIGYQSLRAMYKAWDFVVERAAILYRGAARIVGKILKEDNTRDPVIRIPLTRRHR